MQAVGDRKKDCYQKGTLRRQNSDSSEAAKQGEIKSQPGGAAHRPAGGISFLPVLALPVDGLRRADHHLSILRH